MQSSFGGPVRDDEIGVGVGRQRPELVGEAQVVTHEEADADTGDLDGDELGARADVLVLCGVV